jgi:cytochrome P450
MPSLPYVNAFVREVFRWRPITPDGMHHAVIEEDEYMGYRIPKGTTVVANHWLLDLDGNCSSIFTSSAQNGR